jgi:exonuclease VII large subunit
MPLRKEVLELYNDPNAIKILAIASRESGLHVIHINSMMAPDSESIILATVAMKEVNKNLIQAMTSGELVSVFAVATAVEISTAYQISCKVKEFQTAGPLYDKFLDQLKARSEDLEGVWILKPVEVIDRMPGSNFGKLMS